ncbi:hypothetical protein PULV_a1515 [Pseudoalteromonas ulvae UL12]|nr:hypothetical protein [Pseudoalteromonas ulvae UL12]
MLCWLVFLAALVAFHYARPEIEYGLIRYFDLSVRSTWLGTPRDVLILLLYVCSGLSLVTIFLNRFRARRQSDNLRINLISLLIISISFLLVVIL